ncbi:MAG TPA: carboxypeptidase regulatory-like domain-containing protein, partial [Vicinamibacterales bacterium]|nr:carboxypeptidase regulatory-like domain-containing protein [Vicinamibacterales bacterium]
MRAGPSVRFIVTLLAIAALVSVVPADAQTVSATTGAINGTVTDATKAVLPGVTVTLSGPAVMGTPSTVTDQSGVFRFQALAPADYKLTF